MKNFFKVLLSSIMLFSFTSVNAFATDISSTVRSEGMVLIDAQTGQILSDKNSDKRFPPASTTKVMTALLVLENLELTDIVTVGENPPFAEGSSVALKEGDMYSVESLLHALLLQSSNDTAMAFAEHISGTEEEFGKLMTKRAKELGAKDTNFMNASGLPDDDHYTTAYDLSLVLREALKHEDFIRISQVLSYEMPKSRVDGETKWVNNSTTMYNPNNSNYYADLVAAKTGYTDLARSCYVAAAKRDGQMLITVLLKSENKFHNFEDTRALFDYGFESSDLVKLYSKGDLVTDITVNKTKVPLYTSDDVFFLLKKNEDTLTRGTKTLLETGVKPNLKLEQKDLTKTTFKEGDKILSTDILVDNQVVANIPLLSGVSMEYTPAKGAFDFFKSNIMFIGLGIFATLIAMFIIKDKITHRRYRKRAKKIIFKSKNKNKLHW